jgi:hypothetical protein
MQRPFLLIAALLLLTFHTTAQTKIITGKVIDEDLNPISIVYIQTPDTAFSSRYDINGHFSISIPSDTKSLAIGDIGFESASINLTDSCTQLDIILLFQWTHDFISLKKADKLRMKQFKKLPELHFTAYQKGIFQSDSACYTQNFIPYYHRNKSK